jgi:hypothetical protein
MNSCCVNYYIIPDEVTEPQFEPLEIETSGCSGYCHCGYIQYESLAPYMPRLTNNATKDEDHILLEARLRQQIVEISRLFDAETKVENGFYSKAHYKVIKLMGNGSIYLSIPEFILNSLELYTQNGYLINPETYYYHDGYLVLKPCNNHSNNCGCSTNCGKYDRPTIQLGWTGSFIAKAKFGKECADIAVQMAVRDYLIEHLTFADHKEVIINGYPIARSFRVPHSWATLVQKYIEGKKLHNYFGFA